VISDKRHPEFISGSKKIDTETSSA